MNGKQWVLVIYLALSGLLVVYRGAARRVRRYNAWDATLAPIEIGVLIWLVATL